MDPNLLVLLTACCLLLVPSCSGADQCTCKNCTLWSHLPCEVVPIDCNNNRGPGPEVGPVQNVTVAEYGWSTQVTNAKLYLNVSWKLPERGYEHLTGFLFTLINKEGSSSTCLLLNMTRANWTEADKREKIFYFDCLEIDWESEYYLKIESLPYQREKTPTAEIKRYSRPETIVHDILPADWTTHINVTKIESRQQVTVTFPLFSSQRYSFLQYTVKLENKKHPSDSQDIIIDEHNLSMPVTFSNVCAQGDWRIEVTPRKMGGGLCSEYDQVACLSVPLSCLNQEIQCAHCKVSATEFRFDPVNPCREDSLKDKMPTLIATVVGICAGCLVAAIFMAIIIYYRPTYSSAFRKGPKGPKQVDPRPTQENNNALTTKRVLILYEEDHQYHMDVVHHLACFLQHNCKCDVIMDSWDQNAVRKDHVAWLLKHLDSHISDKIIFVHSEGGYKKYYARNDGDPEIYYSAISPRVDLFVPGVKHIVNERVRGSGYFRSSKKAVSVYLPYTPREFVIPETSPDFIYSLMRDIESLIYHLHDASRENLEVREMAEKAANGRYKDQGNGRHLACAIDKMSNLVKTNPDWFAAAHRKFRKEENHDSGMGTMQSRDIGAILRENESLQPANEALVEENNVEELELKGVKKREDPSHVQPHRQSALRAEEPPVNSSRVSLLRQSFEVKPNSHQSSLTASRDKVRAKSNASKSSRSTDSSCGNLAYVAEHDTLYATPMPKSERSSKASFSDPARDDDIKMSFLKSEDSRPASSSSNDPLYAEVDEGSSSNTNSGKKRRKRSVPDYSAIVDSAFADALYGQSMGEPES